LVQVPVGAALLKSELSTSTTCLPTGEPESARALSVPIGLYCQVIVRLDGPPADVTVRAVCWPISL
jgi:hypothetical protein